LTFSKKEVHPSLTRVPFDARRREKVEKFGIFWGNFPNIGSNQRWLTRPNTQQKIGPTQHRPKIFDLVPSLAVPILPNSLNATFLVYF